MAAGLTVAAARLGELRAYFETALAARVEAQDGHRVEIDAALSARGATVGLIEMLDKAGPYGSGHPEPVFAFPNHRIAFADVVGKGHVRVSLTAPEGTALKAIAFRAAGTALGDGLIAARGRLLHVAGSLVVDTYRGRRDPNLRIVDAAVPD